MRDRARIVVIGGGVGGCSIAYWLTKLGERDVVLVERADLTSGSTFHSAGLVGQLRGSLSLTKMMMSSVDLYRSLQDEVGLETGWREVGSLRLASSRERLEELSRQSGWAKTFDLPLDLISAEEAQRLFPHKWIDPVSIAWISLICILFILPIAPAGVPGNEAFDWNVVNYAPLTVGGAFLLFGGWYVLSARRWFKGPISQGSEEELERIEAQYGRQNPTPTPAPGA